MIKQLFSFYIILMLSSTSFAEIVFFDDFESGLDKWSFTGGPEWAVTDTFSVSSNYSLTESPEGNYLPNMNYYAHIIDSFDLTISDDCVDAWISYQIKYEILTGVMFKFLLMEE